MMRTTKKQRDGIREHGHGPDWRNITLAAFDDLDDLDEVFVQIARLRDAAQQVIDVDDHLEENIKGGVNITDVMGMQIRAMDNWRAALVALDGALGGVRGQSADGNMRDRAEVAELQLAATREALATTNTQLTAAREALRGLLRRVNGEDDQMLPDDDALVEAQRIVEDKAT